MPTHKSDKNKIHMSHANPTKICPTSGKRQYDSENAAQKGLEKFKEKIPNYEGEPYFCMYCGFHHFGSRRKPKKRNS